MPLFRGLVGPGSIPPLPSPFPVCGQVASQAAAPSPPPPLRSNEVQASLPQSLPAVPLPQEEQGRKEEVEGVPPPPPPPPPSSIPKPSSSSSSSSSLLCLLVRLAPVFFSPRRLPHLPRPKRWAGSSLGRPSVVGPPPKATDPHRPTDRTGRTVFAPPPSSSSSFFGRRHRSSSPSPLPPPPQPPPPPLRRSLARETPCRREVEEERKRRRGLECEKIGGEELFFLLLLPPSDHEVIATRESNTIQCFKRGGKERRGARLEKKK